MLLVLVLLVTACGAPKTESGGQGTSSTGSNTTDTKTDSLNLKGKRVALIMEFNTGTFSQQYVQGVEEEVKKFGGTLTKFVADNDKAKMASLLDSAINQQFDVILTDHGDALLETGLKKRFPAISRLSSSMLRSTFQGLSCFHRMTKAWPS